MIGDDDENKLWVGYWILYWINRIYGEDTSARGL